MGKNQKNGKKSKKWEKIKKMGKNQKNEKKSKKWEKIKKYYKSINIINQ